MRRAAVPGLIDTAEAPAGGEPRLVGREALPDEIVLNQRQVRQDLTFEAGVGVSGTQERDQSTEEPSHRYASLTSSLSTRLASRRHRSAWRSTARPPLRDGVVLGLAVVLGPLPRTANPALLLEAHECCVQGALVEGERVVRHLGQPCRQTVGMLRPHGRECTEDDEVERALQELDALGSFTGHRSGDGCERLTCSTGMSSEAGGSAKRRHVERPKGQQA